MKIVVWGLGKHALNRILPAIEENKNLDLYGVFSRNASTVDNVIQEYNCISWETSSEMLKDDSIDIIYSASPTGLHYRQGLEVLNSGKHFWSEKPLVTSFSEAEKLVELSKAKNLSIAEGFMYFYHPHYLWLKEYLEQNKNNQIISIKIQFTMPFPDNPGWRYNPEMGGSTLLDIGTYTLSTILDLFEGEDPEIISKDIRDIEGINIDMNGFVRLLLNSGTTCKLLWGMGMPYKNDIEILMQHASIYTDKFYSKFPDYEPSFILKGNNGEEKIIQVDKCNHFVKMFDHFYTFLTNKKNSEDEKNRILRLSALTDRIKEF